MIKEYIKQCGYSYNRLKDIVYLVGADNEKLVYVDDINARITDLSATTKVISGHNISLTEDTSLDERYLFTKILEISVNGYVRWEDLDEKYYVIVEDMEGTKWMMNVDFPSTVTYTFTLNNNTYATTFTFTCNSNYPMLRLMDELPEPEKVCTQYHIGGVKRLDLIENDMVTYSELANKVTTYGKDLQQVDFAKDSLELTETYDGNIITDTISFRLPLNSYKYSWRYDLLRFTQNKYSAIIAPYTDEYSKICIGFRHGLEAQYGVEAGTDDNSNSITITLTEVSDDGLIFSENLVINDDDQINYISVPTPYDVCTGEGQAQYLLKQGVMGNGKHTGGYKCYSGYTDYFEELGYTIVDEFTDVESYATQKCSEGACRINTNMPFSIQFSIGDEAAKTYFFQAGCDWEIVDVPSYITISQQEGYEGIMYTLEVSNTATTEQRDTFTITVGDYTTMVVTVNVVLSTNRFTPTATTISCLSQNVVFNCPRGYEYTITHLPDGLYITEQTYTTLVLSIPANSSTAWGRSYNIGITDANGSYNLIIAQGHVYEDWYDVDTVCEGGSLYNRQQRFTGATEETMLPLNEYRRGTIIESGSSQCQTSMYRWTDYGHYICQDGDKWTLQEEEYNSGNGIWVKTGAVQLGNMVESGSSYCSQIPVETWVLTNEWICENDVAKVVLYTANGIVSVPCDTSTTITRAEVSGATALSSITSVTLGDCVNYVGTNAFSGCTGIKDITFSDTVQMLSTGAFRNCTGLKYLILPESVKILSTVAFMGCSSLISITMNGVTSIGSDAFQGCTSLTGATVPDTVTGSTRLGSGAFSGCTALKTLKLSTYITEIPESLCQGCENLEQIRIPYGVTKIDNSAFSGCSKLYVIMENSTPPTLDLGGASDYYHFDDVITIAVPQASLTTYKTATGWSKYANNIISY